MAEAVAALARHVCLKAPDRAEPRAHAIKAATEMVPNLARWEQEQFVGFVFHLSRSSKVRHMRKHLVGERTRKRLVGERTCSPHIHTRTRTCTAAHTHAHTLCTASFLLQLSAQIGQRCLAVGLARELLMYLPEPFQQSTFQQAAAAAMDAADGGDSAGEAGMVPAPWSVVCLAALLQRCADTFARLGPVGRWRQARPGYPRLCLGRLPGITQARCLLAARAQPPGPPLLCPAGAATSRRSCARVRCLSCRR